MGVLGDVNPNYTGRKVPPEGAVRPPGYKATPPRHTAEDIHAIAERVWNLYWYGDISFVQYLKWCYTGDLPVTVEKPPVVTGGELDTDDYITITLISLAGLILTGGYPLYLYVYKGKAVAYCIIQFMIIVGYMICLYWVPSVYFGVELNRLPDKREDLPVKEVSPPGVPKSEITQKTDFSAVSLDDEYDEVYNQLENSLNILISVRDRPDTTPEMRAKLNTRIVEVRKELGNRSKSSL
jgi:hypothetical protein